VTVAIVAMVVRVRDGGDDGEKMTTSGEAEGVK
jgi:hypothetical protein